MLIVINLLARLGGNELNSYFTAIDSLMKEVFKKEKLTIEVVAKEMANRLERGGIIQLFGCGHSHLLSAEPFYRAGGLVPVQPILVESLMLHKGAFQSSVNEKDPGFIRSFEDELTFHPADTVMIISTSGRNPVPIDVAYKAKESGAYTVSIQSLNYSTAGQPSNHHSGHRLEEVVDDILNTHVPVGDGLLDWQGMSFAPASGVMGNILLQATLSRVIEMMIESGIEPPIFKSGNIAGSEAHNKRLMAEYGERIKF